MAKRVTITLGEEIFEVPRLNIGQIEELTEVWQEAQVGEQSPVALMKIQRRLADIVLRRATPKIDDVSSLECSVTELQAAVTRALEFSGFKKGEASEGEAAAA